MRPFIFVLTLSIFLYYSSLGRTGEGEAVIEFDHSLWSQLLSKYVQQGKVAYDGLSKEKESLQQYLDQLRHAQPAQSPRGEQIAFWINAYNACVVSGVLDHWPIRSVKEVRDFFNQRQYFIAGEQLSLDQMEERLRQWKDPRIHFVLVCASGSCPQLPSQAYTGNQLEQQLNDQTSKFLSDPQKGLRLDRKKKIVWVSKIFQWYEQDFVKEGIKKPQDLIASIGQFLPDEVRQELETNEYRIRYLDYDWGLNKR